MATAKIIRLKRDQVVPVGTTRPSTLSETQFQAINGSAWVLCDGRNIVGSLLWELTGLTVIPDVRGCSIRGKNNGRSDGLQNPNGELALGIFDGHARKSHGHSIDSSSGAHPHRTLLYADDVANSGTGAELMDNDAGGSTSNDYWYTDTGSSSYDGRHSHTVNNDGGNEDRASNVTTNFFMKVN